MQFTKNLGSFLGGYDSKLVQFGWRAERYFHEDPVTTVLVLRQFAELLCKQVAARHSLYRDGRETFMVLMSREVEANDRKYIKLKGSMP